jgi:hypothetical protein
MSNQDGAVTDHDRTPADDDQLALDHGGAPACGQPPSPFEASGVRADQHRVAACRAAPLVAVGPVPVIAWRLLEGA